jgi:hypothetical protein
MANLTSGGSFKLRDKQKPDAFRVIGLGRNYTREGLGICGA